MHLTTVEIHLDASAVVQLFSTSSNTNICAMPLIDDCRQLLSQIAHVRIAHCFREANLCADFLACVGTKQDRNFVLYNDPPVDLRELLSSDKEGLYHNRSICDHFLPLNSWLMQFPIYQKNIYILKMAIVQKYKNKLLSHNRPIRLGYRTRSRLNTATKEVQ